MWRVQRRNTYSRRIFINLLNHFSTLKNPFTNPSILPPNLSNSPLNPFSPFSLIPSSIGPNHFTKPMPKILLKLSLIPTPLPPKIFPMSRSLIINVIPFINLFVELPSTFTMSDTVVKFTCIDCSIGPFVSPLTFRLSIRIRSLITVSIAKNLDPLPMFIPRLNLPPILRLLGNNPPNTLSPPKFPPSFIPLPLPLLAPLALPRDPNPLPMPDPINKPPNIHISIAPQKYSRNVLGLIIYKISYINVTIYVL